MPVDIQNAETGENTPKNPWLKRGDDSRKALAEAEAKTEAKRAEFGKAWRFMINKNKCDVDHEITFLDGVLGEDGLLNLPTFWEHTLYWNGRWNNYICTDETDPCPICAGNHSPSFVGLLTVLDHTPYTTRDNKVIVNEKKLYVPKRRTIKALAKAANLHDGSLVGCTFVVSRTDENSASVGDVMNFKEQRTLAQLMKTYETDDVSPLNYDEELIYRSAADLREMGVGVSVSTVGGPAPGGSQAGSSDLGDQL